MSAIAIRLLRLSKRYRIGPQEPYHALRDVLAGALSAPFTGRANARVSAERRDSRHIWALKDVSFDVREGEVLGIIGRNGAGKSTLLKILSRITKPTEGQAELRGRVGSLLEVGTGFHPELTGRENVYLNGAMLGMRKREIDRRFDQIVDFAEVARFIDTPVKQYSSGMYVRLAFAVAAHLDRELLIIDEVLGVGDLAFQRKCLGKMGEVAGGGRTVLFVSHQMNQIRRLCQTCAWLDGGTVRSLGRAAEVVSAYETAMSSGETAGSRPHATNAKARFMEWEIADPGPEGDKHSLGTLGPVELRFLLDISQPMDDAFHSIALYSTAERQVLWGHSTRGLRFAPGRHEIVYRLEHLPLQPGPYQWVVTLLDATGVIDLWECLPNMLVTTRPFNREQDAWMGVLNPRFEITMDGKPLGGE